MKVVAALMAGAVLITAVATILFFAWKDNSFTYESKVKDIPAEVKPEVSELVEKDLALHVKTPESVKAIYITSWVAGTPYWRDELIQFVEETELNAVVIDIKDDTGRISFKVESELLNELGSPEQRIGDIKGFIEVLHSKDIYVIGRVSVFQDPYLVKAKPELAVKRESDGGIWQDRKGLTWLDAGSKEVWDYAIEIARVSHEVGFDEINFDYIRFPSDGNLQDISYPISKERKRVKVMEDFFKYLSEEIGDEFPISADLFGLVTTARDDLGIGQELKIALPYFDYISPMIYPSHFAVGTFGYANPASYPYEIVFESMHQAVERITATSTPRIVTVGTSTNTIYDPQAYFPKEKLRPWIQDFDLGADYGGAEVRAQIKALSDLGLYSYMIWDPSNKYSRSAFEKSLLQQLPATQ